MSTGHDAGVEPKTYEEMRAILGLGDTPKLMADNFDVDRNHDIAYAGGVSVDRKTVYVDRWLCEQIRSGNHKIRGLSPRQVIDRIIDHEHTEKAVDDGDNPCDIYQPAHAFALRKEHEGVDTIAGQYASARYEEDLRPLLVACQTRFLKLGDKANPPRDLWCGPYLDHPDKDDLKIIAIMKANGVMDAFKVSKFSVHYGIGKEECRSCAMFASSPAAPLRKCELVAGLVRDSRYCDKWTAKS